MPYVWQGCEKSKDCYRDPGHTGKCGSIGKARGCKPCPHCHHATPHEDEEVYCEVKDCNCDRTAVENFYGEPAPKVVAFDAVKLRKHYDLTETNEHKYPHMRVVGDEDIMACLKEIDRLQSALAFAEEQNQHLGRIATERYEEIESLKTDNKRLEEEAASLRIENWKEDRR